jgi:hypothetical protein
MTLVVASPLKLVADLDALSKSVELPLPLGQSLLPTLTSLFDPSVAKMSRETLDHLDASRPLAVVWLAQGSDAPAGWCAAIAFKERPSALDSLHGIGTAGAQNPGVVERRLPSGEPVWGAVKDRQLLLSSSRETLLAAAALAITAQATPMSGQALFTLSPSVMARSTGQSLDVVASSVLRAALADMEKDTTGKGKLITPAAKRMTEALLPILVRPLTEIAVVRVSLDIGSGRGVVLRAEVQPTPGSDLAAKVAHGSPYAFDSDLPVHSDASAVVGWGDMAPWLADVTTVVEASGPAGQAASRDLRAVFGESLDGGSCAADVGSVPIHMMCSLSVRPGVDASAALTKYLAFVQSSNAWEAEIDGRKAKPIKVKRAGKVVEIEKTIERKDPQAVAVMKGIVGGERVHAAMTVKKGRVIIAMGPKPREMLDSYGKQQQPVKTTAPILARTLLDTAGADTLGSVDVASVITKLAMTSKDARNAPLGGMMMTMPALAELRAPVVLTGQAKGGPAIELQIPFGSLQNVARVVSAFMGQMGAPPAR